MTFIVILIALVIERFFDWSHVRQFGWFKAWQTFLVRQYQVSPAVILVFSVLPFMIALVTLQLLLRDWLFGFVNLVFQLVLLIYCLGPKNLWAEGFACINGLTNDDPLAINTQVASQSPALQYHFLNNIFIESNNRVFAVIFWYILLGVAGALLYRLIVLSTQSDPALKSPANKCLDVLNWIPARILTFLFALGGHFGQVIECWRKKVLVGLDSNEMILTECGSAAVDASADAVSADGTLERSAIGLLDRVFIITLAIIALSVFLS